jgi:hypothetical protein
MLVQEYSLALWNACNTVLNEHDSTTQVIVNAELNHAISQLYAQQSSFSPILQSYFHTPLEDFLKRPVRYRQRWLRLATLVTLHSSSSDSRQQLLSTHFPYVSPPEVINRPAVLHPTVIPGIPGILHQHSLPFKPTFPLWSLSGQQWHLYSEILFPWFIVYYLYQVLVLVQLLVLQLTEIASWQRGTKLREPSTHYTQICPNYR